MAKTFQIRNDQRCIFVGRTGSGKTTLADLLIRHLGYRTVVIDPKHLWEFPGYQLVTEYNPDPNVVRQLFRPRLREGDGWRDTEAYLNAVWSYGIPTVVYVDELTALSTPRKTIPVLADMVRLGRQRKIVPWTATQRPKEVPNLFLTEADHWFVFDLRHEDDRKKVAGFLGKKVEGRLPEDYAFWYANPGERDALLVRQ